MSACFAFALTAGNPIGDASLAAGTNKIWTGLPKLIVVLLGGFTTNFIWCALLNLKNRSGYQYFSSHIHPEHAPAPGADEVGNPISRYRCRPTTFFPRWPAPAGISSFSSTRWARRRWANSALPVGRCTWRASSSSAPCGVGSSTNGKVPAGRRICSLRAASQPWFSPRV